MKDLARRQIIYAEDFGAVGDGKTDDGPAVQKAIDSATGPADVILPKNVTFDGAVDVKGGVAICGYRPRRQALTPKRRNPA